MKTIKIILALVVLAFSVDGWATTLVNENFDDQAYSAPMHIYMEDGYDSDIVYTATNARGGSGRCVAFNDATGNYQVFTLDNIATHLDAGVYIRYYIFFDSAYQFGKDMGGLDNKKLLKFAGPTNGEPDIEILYRPYDSGLDVYCPQDTGHVERYFSYTGGIIKGQWNKIEVYIKVKSGENKLHVHINDHEVCDYVPGFQTPASGYACSGACQFISSRSTQYPPAGAGYWWVDDIFIASGDGDLVGSDEGESTPAPPTISNCTISNGRVQ